MAEHIANDFLDAIVAVFPDMNKGWAITVLLGCFMLLVTAHRIVRELLKADRK